MAEAALTLRGLARGDAAALARLPGAPLGLDEQLVDVAHRGGQNVVVATRGGAVCGAVGWVDAPPWCYAAPFLAEDEATAAALVAHVVAHARASGAARIRAGADAVETGKLAALRSSRFSHVLDFVDLVRPVGAVAVAALPWRRVGWDGLDAARLTEVYNDTFDGVPNAPPYTALAMAAELASPATSRAATAAWADEDGRYVAFVHVTRGDGFASIESIGVRAEMRGRRIADAILDDVIARLDVPELRARIASTNTPSLALHARKGFRERSRRGVYEISL